MHSLQPSYLASLAMPPRVAGLFSLSDLEKACPMVSRDMIRRVLFDLKKENVVECLGRGRSAKWRIIG